MNKKGLIAFILLVILTGGGYWFFKIQKSNDPDGNTQIACTQEAKVCADGTTVGRIGPNCEFAVCPPDSSAEASAKVEASCENEECPSGESKDSVPANNSIYNASSSKDECAGTFIFPNGGEKLFIGNNQTISWSMPDGDTYYTIYLDLVSEGGNIIGSIINWNWVKYDPIHSVQWDVETIYTTITTQPTQIQLQPGEYKLQFRYEYADSKSLHIAHCPLMGSFESQKFIILTK